MRAVVQAFADQNWEGFHASDGSGYAFIAEQILRFDAQNPSLAARFCDAFSRWYKCVEPAARCGACTCTSWQRMKRCRPTFAKLSKDAEGRRHRRSQMKPSAAVAPISIHWCTMHRSPR